MQPVGISLGGQHLAQLLLLLFDTFVFVRTNVIACKACFKLFIYIFKGLLSAIVHV